MLRSIRSHLREQAERMRKGFLLVCMGVQLLTDLPRCVPQDISNATWAFATLRHHPGNTLMDAAAATAARTMPHFKPQEIANTLWCGAHSN